MKAFLALALAILIVPCHSQEIILFLDDHYKSVGAPLLQASSQNPVIAPGHNTSLRIVVANMGRIEALIPVNIQPGQEAVATREMMYEMGSVNAQNITLRLTPHGESSIHPLQQSIPFLPSGSTASAEFQISDPNGTSGSQNITLEMEYEYQGDVSLNGDNVSPLYRPGKVVQNIYLWVRGEPNPFRAEGGPSRLKIGRNNTILFAVRNLTPQEAKNCTAWLMAVPPLRGSESPSYLGNISPGGVSVARFWAFVEDQAPPKEYRLACQIHYDDGGATIALPVVLERDGGVFWAFPMLALVVGVSVLLWSRRLLIKSWKRG